MSEGRRARLKRWARRSAVLALALPAAAVFAQTLETVPLAPPVPLAPRNIVPQGPTRAPAPETRALPPAVQTQRGPAPVQVGDLGTLEGPVAGTLEGAAGFGPTAWQTADRAATIAILQGLPASTPSAAYRLLMRKILLTAAAPPPGRATESFNRLRLLKLVEGYYTDDAADLALRLQAPANTDLLLLQTEALIYAGRDAEACGPLTERRLDSAEVFWVELRAYCLAIARETGPLELTRAVIVEQGITDPAFVTLLDGLVSGMAVLPEVLRAPDSIHIAMMAKLGLPMSAEIGSGLGPSAGAVAAASQTTPRQIRATAAERALRMGALPRERLVQILDLWTFTPEELAAAPARARAEPLLPALARIKAAAAAGTDEARAELVHTAFEIGENQGVFAPVADLFAEQAGAIQPMREWANWSERMVRGLLLAGQGEAAQRWLDILDRAQPGVADLAEQLTLALALAAPSPPRTAAAAAVLAELARRVTPPPPPTPPLFPYFPLAPDHFPLPPPPPIPPKPPQPLLGRATLDLGLFDALGLIAQNARGAPLAAAVGLLMEEQSPGRRPSAMLMQRIGRGGGADARGELALGTLVALGRKGAGDLAPDVVVRFVRALQAAGIPDGARAVAREALLRRPLAGAPARP